MRIPIFLGGTNSVAYAAEVRMSPKVIGVILLVGGAVLLYMGWQEKESLSSSVSETVHGTPTDRSMWFLGGGAVAVILGAGMVFKGGKLK